MEFSREIIVDVLLNMAGYVTAGALWLVLWSAFNSRNKSVAQPAVAREVGRTPGQAAEKRAEFVSLKTDATPDTESGERDRLRAEVTRYQRNRSEVIRLAREMLRSGSTQEKVRSLLPISEGELALLANE
jgi:hypothetical protein